MDKYFIATDEGLQEEEGEIFILKNNQFRCAVRSEVVNDKWGAYDWQKVTELSTGAKVLTMAGSKEDAIKETNRLFDEHSHANFIQRATNFLRSYNLTFPVNGK